MDLWPSSSTHRPSLDRQSTPLCSAHPTEGRTGAQAIDPSASDAIAVTAGDLTIDSGVQIVTGG
jgi:hypothetical protein